MAELRLPALFLVMAAIATLALLMPSLTGL